MYSKKLVKEILQSMNNTRFYISDAEKIANFLSDFDEKIITDVLTFFKSLKSLMNNRIEIFFIDNENYKGIYIDIAFNKNADFSKVDEVINKIYDLLDNINKDLWFINIGEKFSK